MSTSFLPYNNNHDYNNNRTNILENRQQQIQQHQQYNWDFIRFLKSIPFIFIILISFSFFVSNQINDTFRSLTQLTTSMMYDNDNNNNYYYKTSSFQIMKDDNDTNNNTFNEQYNGSNIIVSAINSFVQNNTSNPTINQKILEDRTMDGRENKTSHQDINHFSDHQYHNPLVWLLSFPNSGTTYTLHLIQEITNTTTATNYGKEQVGSTTSIPINPNEPNGPYYRSPELNPPRNESSTNNHSVSSSKRNITTPYVLTKSHCEPHHIDITKEQFAKSCSTGDRKINREFQKHIHYNYLNANIQKVIHLIRNPFDNIVARMHYEQKKWIKQNTSDDIEHLTFFTNTIEGFGLWCMYKDKLTENHHNLKNILHKFQYNNNDNDNTTTTNFTSWNDLYDQDGTIPFCIAEFYRYLQWHNYVVELTTPTTTKWSNETMPKEKNDTNDDDNNEYFENLPVMYLYYENYTQITESIIPSDQGTSSKYETDNTISQRKQEQQNKKHATTAKDIVSKNIVIMELLQFLEFDIDIDVIGLPAPFIQGKTYYTTYYTDDERRLLSKYAKNYLSPKAYKLLEHYFIT